MTAPHRDHPRGAEHEHVAEILPWYVNASLSREETALVDEHLAACAACRDELARCRALSLAARSAPQGEEGWAASPRHFAGVLARIEASEQRRLGARGRALLDRLRSWVSDTPSPVRWAFAVQGVAALALAAALLGRAPRPPPAYETLSRPAPAQVAERDRARLHLVLAEETTERELRDLLHGIDGVLVGGPSPRAVYTVELPVGGSDRERVDAIAARLRGERRVRFVAVVPARSP
jgi:anti-sigma factor RsiW